jgi:hypothetical protein
VDQGAPAPLAYVQIAVTTQTASESSVTTKLGKAVAAGDLIVVAIGWFDTTGVIDSVTDTAGNTYRLAIGPITLGADLTQSLYYASGVAASPNDAVTVKFATNAAGPDLRVVEYSGADPASPLDQTVNGSGNGTAATTGSVTTTSAREIVFAAGMSSQTLSTPGSGFTLRVVTSQGNMVEDRFLTSAGSVSGSATVSPSGEWIMQVATFH